MKAPRSYSLALAALALGLVAAAAAATPAVVPLTLPSGKVLQAEVMVSDEDRAMGLMFRPSLPLDRGMIFLFETPDFHGIWMKNCRFPIDILWLDEAKKIVHVVESVPPCKAEPCPVYNPLRKAAWVIELNARRPSSGRRSGSTCPRESAGHSEGACPRSGYFSPSFSRFFPNRNATRTPRP
jgi:uncharacterized membrane protein (UPF0127 family)